MEQQLLESYPVCDRLLDDDELNAVLEGIGAPSTFEHVAHCPSCTERITSVARLELALRVRLFRVLCPTSEELASFLAERVSVIQKMQIATHVEACPHCQQELHVLRNVLPAARPASQRPGNHPPMLHC